MIKRWFILRCKDMKKNANVCNFAVDMKRKDREKRVVGQMTAIYCRRHHGSRAICPECESLLDYAFRRIDSCPKGDNKSSCRKCEIHCYSPQRREQVRRVMRYVGPRMIFYHPVSALRHIWDELRTR